MGTTGLAEGHEKTGTGATWQSDGLRDTDVLSTASLTAFVERGLLNGVIPLTLTNYSNDSGGSDRNNPISGNCVVRKNTGGATNSIFVDTGVAYLDGMFYNVGNVAAFNVDNVAYYNARFNAGGMVLPTGANEECWVLVTVDPELAGTNNIGLVGGTVVDTSTGIYPQMPSSHLIKQSCILGAIRVGFAVPVNAIAVEDKRIFIRGGPLPLTALADAGGGADPENTYGTSPALTPGNLPVATLGTVYARNPAGYNPLNANIHGSGQTHLFYQADIAVGAVAGGAYQITPIHRQASEVNPYVGAGASAVPLQFTPLSVENAAGAATKHIISAVWTDPTKKTVPLIEGLHYTIAAKIITYLDLAATVPAPQGPLGPGDIWLHYTHSGI